MNTLARVLLIVISFFLGESTVWLIGRFENPYVYVFFAIPSVAIGLCELYVSWILVWICWVWFTPMPCLQNDIIDDVWFYLHE